MAKQKGVIEPTYKVDFNIRATLRLTESQLKDLEKKDMKAGKREIVDSELQAMFMTLFNQIITDIKYPDIQGNGASVEAVLLP